MRFITISQYFNKLQIALFFLLIVPLLAFIALYFFLEQITPEPQQEYATVIIPAVALMDWLLAMIIDDKKIKSARKEQGLGAKLDKYFGITIIRYGFLSGGAFCCQRDFIAREATCLPGFTSLAGAFRAVANGLAHLPRPCAEGG